MNFGYFNYPCPVNEPTLSYAPGSAERVHLKNALQNAKRKVLDIPMIIGGKNVKTQNKHSVHPPHEIKHTLAHYYEGGKKEIKPNASATFKISIRPKDIKAKLEALVTVVCNDPNGPVRLIKVTAEK